MGTYFDPLEKKSTDLELDIIASGANKKLLIIAECKWWTKEITNQDINLFKEKSDKFKLLTMEKISSFENIELWFFSRTKIKKDLQSVFKVIKFFSMEEMEQFYTNIE